MDNSPSPRVAITNARNRKFDIGTIIYKNYVNPDSNKKEFYCGVVTDFKHPYYRVVYDDGEFEDMTPTKFSQHVRRKIKANAVTHHKTGEKM